MARYANVALSTVAAVLLGSAAALAQSPGWAGLPMQSTVLRNMLNNATHGQAGPYAAGRAPSYAPAPRTLRPVGPSSLPYGDDPAVTARVLNSFLEGVQQHSGPVVAERLRQVFARTDFRQQWAQMVAADGLSPGDLVDAMSAYWVLDWMIVHRADNNRAQTQAARSQVARAIAMTPGLARLDSASRQTLAETLMLREVVQAAMYLNALRNRDQAALQTLSASTQRSFDQDFGMNLAAYNLTSNGFVAAD